MTVSVVGTGLGSGQVNESFSWANIAANEQVTAVTLNVGANTITVPTLLASPIGFVFVPPATNLNAITLKGITGDTGIPLSPSNPVVISFPASPPATFVLTATGGSVPGCLIRWI